MVRSARAAVKGAGGALLAVVSFASIALTSAPPAALAATALVMGGTDQPHPAELGDYLPRVEQYFLDPATSCKVSTCHLEPVDYPAQFWPFPQWGGQDALKYDRSVADGVVSLGAALQNELAAGSDETIAVFGSSQSSTVVTIVKRGLTTASPEVKSRLEFVMIGNPNRPNGGLLSRFHPLSVPVLEFSANGATPTDTGIKTTDIAFQYDIAADFPRYPLNPFALLNSLIGIDVHGSYTTTRNGYTELELQQAIDNPANRQTFGDTTYITIPTKDLPLVQPIRQFGAAQGISAITEPLVAMIEPTLRVLVELGYDRSVEYGRPTSGGLFPLVDPGKLISDLASAAQKGLTDAHAEITAPQRSSRRTVDAPPTVVPVSGTTDDDSESHQGFTFLRQDADDNDRELGDGEPKLLRDVTSRHETKPARAHHHTAAAKQNSAKRDNAKRDNEPNTESKAPDNKAQRH